VTVGHIFNVVRFISRGTRLSLPFTEHDKSSNLSNRGVFRHHELITYLAKYANQLLGSHLNETTANATYLSTSSQNEMIGIVDQHIKLEITGHLHL
jgi:Domain of unknown function (DUF4371)